MAVAAWELRRRDVRAGEPFVAPGGAIVPALTCAIIVAVIVATVSWIEMASVGGVMAIAAVVACDDESLGAV